MLGVGRGITGVPPLTYLIDELHEFESLADDLSLTQTAFLHGDFHAHNIVYNSNTGNVRALSNISDWYTFVLYIIE